MSAPLDAAPQKSGADLKSLDQEFHPSAVCHVIRWKKRQWIESHVEVLDSAAFDMYVWSSRHTWAPTRMLEYVWDYFWVRRQYSTWEAASTRCFANPANEPSLGFGRTDHFPLLCDSNTRTPSCITGNPIAISPQVRMHFCLFGPNDMNMLHMLLIGLPSEVPQPQANARSICPNFLQNFRGFQNVVLQCVL